MLLAHVRKHYFPAFRLREPAVHRLPYALNSRTYKAATQQRFLTSSKTLVIFLQLYS